MVVVEEVVVVVVAEEEALGAKAVRQQAPSWATGK